MELSWGGYRSLRRYSRLPRWAIGILILFGILCFLPGVPETLSKPDWMGDWMSPSAISWLCWMGGIGSLGTSLLCLRVRMLLFRSRNLIAQDNLPEELGADAETLAAVMQKRNIQPRLILNGQRFYNRSDFGDLPLLLRPSQAPALADGILLRPVAGDREAQTTNLLRPVPEETFDAVVRINSSTRSE